MRTKTINQKNLAKRVMIFKKFTKKKPSGRLDKILLFFGFTDEPIGRFR
jgi:hypothetical protein